jgi:hypothetical protein
MWSLRGKLDSSDRSAVKEREWMMRSNYTRIEDNYGSSELITNLFTAVLRLQPKFLLLKGLQ